MEFKKIAILLLGVVDVCAVAILLVMLSLMPSFPKQSQVSEVASVNTSNNVLGVAEAPKYLEICCEGSCITIPSETYESFLKDGLLDDTLLKKYVDEKIVPFFENSSGGKTIVSNKGGKFISWNRDIRPNTSKLFEKIKKSFLDGRTGLKIAKEDLPGTDGTFASKYIEIDNSRQKLFVWMDGSVVKEIRLSGPVYGFQVYGVFPIIDKGIEPIAPGGKRMPYWMAFYHSTKQDSWYGLHALIWWYDSAGNKIYEKSANIGTRQSAGCVRMLLADAKYLYENFEKGDMILIHE